MQLKHYKCKGLGIIVTTDNKQTLIAVKSAEGCKVKQRKQWISCESGATNASLHKGHTASCLLLLYVGYLM